MKLPALSVVGWSGAGKTALLTRLLPELLKHGLRVAAVKHTSHDHPLHKPGSDTEALALAGAGPVGLMTPQGLQLQLTGDARWLPDRIAHLAPQTQLLLVEGWKEGPLPKVEVWRAEVGPRLCEGRPELVALVTDDPVPPGALAFRTKDVAPLALHLMTWALREAAT